MSIARELRSLMLAAAAGAAVCVMADGYDVAAIVWPAYQNEPRWRELGIFGDGVGEWQNVYEAVPRFKGHDQPMRPLWGYEADNDPKAVARQIDAALASGVNVFIYDWYWYEGRPFLEGALNDGFLKAPNNGRMRFYILWANHDVNRLWDNKVADKSAGPPVWSASVTDEEFRTKLVPRFISYFRKPNYYRIGGRPVLMIYWTEGFVDGIGGLAAARAALDFLRAETVKAGFPGLHLQANDWGLCAIDRSNPSQNAGVRALGIDSVVLYNTAWHGFPRGTVWGGGGPRNADGSAALVPYGEFADRSYEAQRVLRDKLDVPYFPNVTLGWDNNARFPASVTTGVVTNVTPEALERQLARMKTWLDEDRRLPCKLLVINAWNEWTEGCALQPSVTHGYGFLDAVSEIFGGRKSK